MSLKALASKQHFPWIVSSFKIYSGLSQPTSLIGDPKPWWFSLSTKMCLKVWETSNSVYDLLPRILSHRSLFAVQHSTILYSRGRHGLHLDHKINQWQVFQTKAQSITCRFLCKGRQRWYEVLRKIAAILNNRINYLRNMRTKNSRYVGLAYTLKKGLAVEMAAAECKRFENDCLWYFLHFACEDRTSGPGHMYVVEVVFFSSLSGPTWHWWLHCLLLSSDGYRNQLGIVAETTNARAVTFATGSSH